MASDLFVLHQQKKGMIRLWFHVAPNDNVVRRRCIKGIGVRAAAFRHHLLDFVAVNRLDLLARNTAHVGKMGWLLARYVLDRFGDGVARDGQEYWYISSVEGPSLIIQKKNVHPSSIESQNQAGLTVFICQVTAMSNLAPFGSPTRRWVQD